MSAAVIAMADGYTAEDVRPFVASLRRTGYGGTIVLMTSQLTERLRRLGSDYDLSVMELRELLPSSRVVQRAMRSILFRAASKNVPLLPALTRPIRLIKGSRPTARRGRLLLVAHLFPIALARYAYYRACLDALRVDRVLLTDVRDVVFQRDPFVAGLDFERLQVFAEDPRRSLGACPYNREWLRTGYGPELTAALASQQIVCSGVTLGSHGSVMRYLDLMIEEFMNLRATATGIDQSSHNVLLYHKRLNADVRSNADGPVFTMAYAPAADMRWNAAGELLNAREEPYAVLHQYDRHLGTILTCNDRGSLYPLR